MAKITRISATNHPKPQASAEGTKTATLTSTSKPNQPTKISKLSSKHPKFSFWSKLRHNKVFRILFFPLRLIFKPLGKFGRYVRDSWQEIRQVRWPSRAATWQMTGMVILYTLVFAVLIALLDAGASFIFNQLLKK